MKRVAYISADLGVPIFGRKGCSIHAQEVLTTMLRLGAQVDLFSTSVEGDAAPGLEALRVHALSRPLKGDVSAREQSAILGNDTLRAALKSAGPFDFIYERYSLWSHAGMEFARDTGLPGLLEVNAPLIDEQAQYRVLVDRASAEEVAERVFGAASSLLAVSDEVAAWLERYPAACGKIQVIPNGIRPERFPKGATPSLPAPAGVFTVGFVGTLKAWHGVSILVDAFASLHSRHPDTRLLIVGDGPEREKIEADVEQRNLRESVVLTGAVAPDQVSGLLSSMDVGVAPYPKSGTFYFSPLKVYEYMANGLAVVGSRIGQLQKLIRPGFNGILVDPGDATELAVALEHLKDNPSVRASLGVEARATVLRDYTWEGVVRTIFRLAGTDLNSVPSQMAST